MPRYEATRRRWAPAALALILTALLGACGSSSGGKAATSSASSPSATSTATSTTAQASSQPGPERVPLEPGQALAPASSTSTSRDVDGIMCAPLEQLAYHIHAHLQVYLDGQPRSLPAGIGLLYPVVAEETPVGPFYGATQCYYWLHTHASDGVIHVESPTARIYTLGDFFDEWRQPLSSTQVAGARGNVTAFINGKPWTKSPRALPLLPHAVIQLDVGSPVVPFAMISWAQTGL
jgi:hypothetical protein